MSNEATADFQVICLCADWCGTCRDYRGGFEALAENFPAARFHWLDIEEHGDQLGDLDVENFPTVLVVRGGDVQFFGTLLPHQSHLRRLLETLAEQTAEQSRACARATPERRAWQEDADLGNLRRLHADA